MRGRLRLVLTILAVVVAATAGGSAGASEELCLDAGGPLGLQIPAICVPMP